MNKEIISINEEDKPLIWISEKAINLYKDNKKLQERIDKAIKYIEEHKYCFQDHLHEYENMLEDCEPLLNILRGENDE